ncbi:MAG: DUF4845 domain-containing protein [Gammaproteobacteria bacterium]|nr:DUF4845 domain-containing protein [Gammaproteobacteria bacterium]
MDMKQRQQGMTAIGFIVIASLVAMIGYGGIPLSPIYLTQMKIVKLMNDLKDEYDGAGPTPAKLMTEIGKRLDIDAVDYPKRQDFVISKSDDGFVVEIDYEDEVPYLANLYLTAKFTNSVEISR